ncbi:MAG: NADH-quinone oxidoreductase subunit N, partial [Acidimicrobiales bacterium]|nr:NADH-quinone oxidoreductase subunit N [Acidimicrobiales bacterium]
MAIDFAAIAPELVLTITALVVLLVDLVLKGEAKQLANPIAAIGTIVAIVFTALLWGDDRTTFADSFVISPYAVVFKLVFLGALLAILGVSWRYFAESRFFQGEYYFLLLVSFLGMVIMPSARDLLLLFVALETVSVPAFVMAGLRKRDLYSSEAAIKFFLIGVLSVALMLFGMSMIYGFTGTTNLTGIAEWIAANDTPPLLLASVLLVIVGFGFKVSAVPFHFWAPDTYAGSPMPVAAMLAVASKAAGFAGLMAVTFIAFEPVADVWAPAMGVLAILTMTLGNLIALQQQDIVRLLAYSSVAQAGYMLIPFGLAQSGNA